MCKSSRFNVIIHMESKINILCFILCTNDCYEASEYSYFALVIVKGKALSVFFIYLTYPSQILDNSNNLTMFLLASSFTILVLVQASTNTLTSIVSSFGTIVTVSRYDMLASSLRFRDNNTSMNI